MTGRDPAAPSEAPDPYFEAIEAAFNRRRGAPHLLSPRDWSLVGTWQREGVPLRIVLQGIENCFDAFERRGPGPRRINSLSYCRQEVLSLHDLYRRLHAVEAGRPAASPAEAVPPLQRHLTRLQRRLKEAMTAASNAGRDPLVGALAEARGAVGLLRRGLKSREADPAEVETALARLDAELLERAGALLSDAERRGLEDAAAAELAFETERMSPGALAVTRTALLGRRLRSWGALPRLTLFD
jgi:hypothetical protein